MQLIYKYKKIFLLGLASFFLFVSFAGAVVTGSSDGVDVNSLTDSGTYFQDDINVSNYGGSNGNSEIYQSLESGISEDTNSFIDSISFDNISISFDLGFVDNCTTLTCFIGNMIATVKGLIMIVIGMSVLAFLWGLVKYVKSVDDKTRQEAVGTITYGVLSLFVMVSVWGLVNLLTSSFDFSSSMNSLQNKNINPTSLIKKK